MLRGVGVGAQAAKFDKPEEVLKSFKTTKVQTDVRRDIRGRNYNYPVKPSSNLLKNNTTSFKRTKSNNIVYFNCNEPGHPKLKMC